MKRDKCETHGCENYAVAKGLCKSCYEKQRRAALKIIAAAGAAVGVAAVPDKWVRPVVETVVLPLHAQTSPPGPTTTPRPTTTEKPSPTTTVAPTTTEKPVPTTTTTIQPEQCWMKIVKKRKNTVIELYPNGRPPGIGEPVEVEAPPGWTVILTTSEGDRMRFRHPVIGLTIESDGCIWAPVDIWIE